MLCKNCGAKISEEELLCPYCGTENLKVAQKEQRDYIEGYKEKKRALEKVPQKVMKNTTKWLVYGASSVLGITILLILVVMAFSKLTQGDMLAKQEKELAKLEKYYEAGDYESMSKYLDKVVRRGGSYDKYWRIADLYDSMDWQIEALASNAEYVKTIDLDATDVETDIERCVVVLAEIQEMEELEFPYDEKTGVLYIKDQYISALKEYALLTDEEIESAVLNFDDNGNDYMELAEISIQRMEEKFR